MTAAPSASTVASVGIGIPLATVAAWCMQQFASIEVPGEVQAAFGALVSAGVGYLFAGGKRRDME